jgi:hypothetical protein
VFVHHFVMHEFCYCEALKVFKIIYEKNCEKGVKGFDLKRFEKLFKKDMKKRKKRNQIPNPFPLSLSPTTQPTAGPAIFQAQQTPPAHLIPFLLFFFPRGPDWFARPVSLPCGPTPSPSLTAADRWDPPVSSFLNLRPLPSSAMAGHTASSPASRASSPSRCCA